MTIQLRLYQRQAVEEAAELIAGTDGLTDGALQGGMIEMATGMGKSVVIAAIADAAEASGHICVHLVHSLKLIAQNADEYLKYTNTAGDTVRFVRGNRRIKPGGRHFFCNPLSIYNTLGRQKGALAQVRRDAILEAYSASQEPDKPRCLVVLVDEAHYSYTEGSHVDLFLQECRKRYPAICLIGLTATPYISMEIGGSQRYYLMRVCHMCAELENRYVNIAGPGSMYSRHIGPRATIDYGVENGYLVPVKVITGLVKDPEPKKKPRAGTPEKEARDSDIAKEDAEALEQNEGYGRIMSLVAEIMQRRGATREPQAVIFMPTVESAKKLWMLIAEAIDDGGFETYTVEYVTGDDSNGLDRENIYRDFKEGHLNILINVNLLTTGINFPALENIIIARRIRSAILRTQIYGRGTRPSPDTGKTRCNIYELFSVEPSADIDALACAEPCPEVHAGAEVKQPVYTISWEQYTQLQQMLDYEMRCVCGAKVRLLDDGKQCACGRDIKVVRAYDFRRYYVDLLLDFRERYLKDPGLTQARAAEKLLKGARCLKAVRTALYTGREPAGAMLANPIAKAFYERVLTTVNPDPDDIGLYVQNCGGYKAWTNPEFHCPHCAGRHYADVAVCPEYDLPVLPGLGGGHEYRLDEDGQGKSIRYRGLNFTIVHSKDISVEVRQCEKQLYSHEIGARRYRSIYYKELYIEYPVGDGSYRSGVIFPRKVLNLDKNEGRSISPVEFMQGEGIVKPGFTLPANYHNIYSEMNAPNRGAGMSGSYDILVDKMAAKLRERLNEEPEWGLCVQNWDGRKCIYITYC